MLDLRPAQARADARRPRRLYRRRAGRRRHQPSGVPRGRADRSPALYDLKADPAKRELFSFEEDGERISLYWLRCRNRDDLARRMRCCKAIADATYGFIGRSPDQVSGLITGPGDESPACSTACMRASAQNLLRYYDHAREERPLSQLRGDAGERPQERRAVSRASSATIPTCRSSPRTTRASPSRA